MEFIDTTYFVLSYLIAYSIEVELCVKFLALFRLQFHIKFVNQM